MRDKNSLFLAVLVPSLILLNIALTSLARATGNEENFLIIFLDPIPSKNGWRGVVYADIEGVRFNCSGYVAANPYYRETRAVSVSLLSVPLYYVLDTVCPRLTAFLGVMRPSQGVIHIVIRVPQDCYVYTAMDLRGFGGNGSYLLPLRLFVTQYIFDGVVVASKKHYRAAAERGIILVEPLNESGHSIIAEAINCVNGFLLHCLGPSNRSPVVVAVAAKWDHPYMLTGIGYSLGGVVYIKPGNDLPSLVHLAAHEAVHSWIGKGRLQGGVSLVEGAAELLSLIALHTCDRDLYKKALLYEETSQEANPYAVWLRLHAALRKASLEACGRDLYLEALRSLYSRGGKDADILNLLASMKELAEQHNCLESLEEELGKELLNAGNESLQQLLCMDGTTKTRTVSRTWAIRGITTTATKEKKPPITRAEKESSPLITNTVAASHIHKAYSDEAGQRNTINNTCYTPKSSGTSSIMSRFVSRYWFLLIVFVAGFILWLVRCNRNIF